MLISIDEAKNMLVAFPASGETQVVPEFTAGKLEAKAAIDAEDEQRLRRACIPAEAVAWASVSRTKPRDLPRGGERRRNIVRQATALELPDEHEVVSFRLVDGKLMSFGMEVPDRLALLLWKLVMQGDSIRSLTRTLIESSIARIETGTRAS